MSEVHTVSPAWRAALAQLCERTGVSDLPADLIGKTQRPLFGGGLDKASRTRLLRRHYETLLSTLGTDAVARLLRGERLTIATINGLSGRRYLVDMGRDGRTGREGELTLRLAIADRLEKPLATLTLTLGDIAPGAPLTLWIGGTQSQGDPAGLRANAAAANDLWDLQPAQVVLELAYALAHVIGAGALKAASDPTAIWSDTGARADGQGAFNLPTVRLGRALETSETGRIASRARGVILDTLGAGFRDLAVG